MLNNIHIYYSLDFREKSWDSACVTNETGMSSYENESHRLFCFARISWSLMSFAVGTKFVGVDFLLRLGIVALNPPRLKLLLVLATFFWKIKSFAHAQCYEFKCNISADEHKNILPKVYNFWYVR